MLSYVANRLYQGYQYSWSLIPTFRGRQTYKQPSRVTECKIVKLCDILDKLQNLRQKQVGSEGDSLYSINGDQNLQYLVIEFIKILEKLPSYEDLSTLTDRTNYNLLQKAIIALENDLIPVIVEKGWNVNNGECSLPLHLACKLGQLETVQLLLNNGARPDVKSSVCYPDDHNVAACGSVPLVSYFRKTQQCLGNCKPQLAIFYAVDNDHVDVMKILLSDTYHDDNTYQHQELLDSACKYGAFDCMKFLVQTEENLVNKNTTFDDSAAAGFDNGYIANIYNYFLSHNSLNIDGKNADGYSPLLLACAHGEKFIKFLIQHSANARVTTSLGETVLHAIFRKNFAPLELVNCVKLLLGSGLEQDVDNVDIYGNTALHYVVSHLNHNISCTTSTDILCFDRKFMCSVETDIDENLQMKYQDEILNCLEILLQHNSDPNIKNKAKVSAFQKMLQTLYNCIRNMFRHHGDDQNGHNHAGGDNRNTRMYCLNLDVINRAIFLFLKYGVDVNDCSPAGLTPLRMVLQILLNIEPSQLYLYSDNLLETVKILCSYGAETNFYLGNNGGTCVTMVTAMSEGCLCFPDYSDELKAINADFISNLLALLLENGMNPNYSTLRRRPFLQGGVGNGLVEFVKLTHSITKPSDLLFIYQWVLTLLQYGANPDIEPYSSEPTICHSQSNIFLRQNKTQAITHYMHQIKDIAAVFEDGYAEKLLNLFYFSMDHCAMYQCLNMAKSRFDCLNNTGFTELLNSICSQPRTLKQNARVAIYKAMGRRLAGNVDKLQLPKALQSYLLNIEP